MAAYYNEIDPYAAEWLRNLIMLGHIADGIVDTRSISEVQPDDLREFTQCHFFAGIGVWSHALRLAGWPDDRPVWTGSCPCQPFSSAGRSGGFADERHLWPHWQHLIRECKPGVVFGEQVASKDGLAWLDLVHDDMEGEGYAFTAVDLCAAGVGAPHIRQRLFFVADAGLYGHPPSEDRGSASASETERGLLELTGARSPGGLADAASDRRKWKGSTAEVQAGRGQGSTERGELQGGPQGCGVVTVQRATLQGTGGMADAELYKQRQRGRSTSEGAEGYESGIESGGCGQVSGVADAESERRTRELLRAGAGLQANRIAQDGHACERPGPTNGHWRAADWLLCRDGKWRPVEPGAFPLAHGAPARVGRLRAYGNAIVPQVAAEVIRTYIETR